MTELLADPRAPQRVGLSSGQILGGADGHADLMIGRMRSKLSDYIFGVAMLSRVG